MWSAIRPVAARNGLRVGTAARTLTKTAGAGRGLVARADAHLLSHSSQLPLGAFRTQARSFAAATTTTTATKAAPKKKAAAGTKKKTAAKKKPAAKKKVAVTAKKAPRKVQTPEEKKKLQVRELKKVALLKEPSKLPEHPWILYITESTKGTKTDGGKASLGKIMPELSQSFKALPQLELQRLRDTADKNRAANAVAHKAWVESHPATQIADANRARQHLNRLTASSSKHRNIQDSRQPKRPLTAFSIFTQEQWATGQFAGRSLSEAAKALAVEWKGLLDSERHRYENRAKIESERYEKEVEAVFGRTVAKSTSASP